MITLKLFWEEKYSNLRERERISDYNKTGDEELLMWKTVGFYERKMLREHRLLNNKDHSVIYEQTEHILWSRLLTEANLWCNGRTSLYCVHKMQ